jgi:hypothetical protein
VTKKPTAEEELMRSNWTAFLLVLSAVLILVVNRRLDLLALAAPLALVASWIGVYMSASRSGQRRI